MDETALQLVQQMLAQQGAALELFARQWCHTPEDVVQEALLRLARERPLPDRPIAWLYFAVRRGALSAARSANCRHKHEGAAARPVEWFERDIGQTLDAATAAMALEELPLPEREVIVSRLWGGLSFQEVGELVGCSSSAAQRRYVAALRERFGVPCPPLKNSPQS